VRKANLSVDVLLNFVRQCIWNNRTFWKTLHGPRFLMREDVEPSPSITAQKALGCVGITHTMWTLFTSPTAEHDPVQKLAHGIFADHGLSPDVCIRNKFKVDAFCYLYYGCNQTVATRDGLFTHPYAPYDTDTGSRIRGPCLILPPDLWRIYATFGALRTHLTQVARSRITSDEQAAELAWSTANEVLTYINTFVAPDHRLDITTLKDMMRSLCPLPPPSNEDQ
jgi:hypothetical protein